MTKEQLTNEITQQLHVGFSFYDIKRNLLQKGYDINEITAVINEFAARGRKTSINNSAKIFAILIMITGLIQIITLRAVSGSLDFTFDSPGDMRRWKELFFQPWGGIMLIVMGIVVLAGKKTVGTVIIRLAGITWFSFLMILSGISNDLLNLLLSVASIVFLVFITRKVK